MSYLAFLASFGVSGAHPGGFRLTKKMLATLGLREDMNILDAGCGTGETAAYIAETWGAKVSCIELNPLMADKAEKRMADRGLQMNIHRGSVEDMPYEDNQFDLVLSESVLAFVKKPAALREMHRVLKKNGVLIANELTLLNRLPAHSEREIADTYGLDTVLQQEDWIQLLFNSGFSHLHTFREEPMWQQAQHDYQPSVNLPPELIENYKQHLLIMGKYQEHLSYKIFQGRK
ncbi:methyltransferase domain-containing protein [Bacillus lacus]|uniref:Methyltransferase domain-containing protein n=1 Tax=Metabacillus lacus TaxID=1983721 RepID=A0A7X2J102_9BACI|nr:class I SAM-dependent methyltransferase [Metabacillus lacus]MRX73443.1 methyltransferase domain-containing protein [Metabacillus lacus]